jgi:uncharacterized membrane protein YfcA
MMTPTLDALWLFPLFLITSFAVSWVNAVTGGGGLVVLPIFLAAGFPRTWP